ncbi:MAG TPA: hypothetical protein VIY08_06350 [Candidatus Nitrosocosmicus sp.]
MFTLSKVNNESFISDVNLKKSNTKSNIGNVTMNLNFAIKGTIRDIFTQKNWEKAYNKYDNILRLTIKLDIKSNGHVIDSKKMIRKAILFWTRNPKITHRIWITIVKDESPFFPLEEEEAKDLLFDFQKELEIVSSKLKKGKNKISVVIDVSWGKHEYIEKNVITKETNIEEIDIDG